MLRALVRTIRRARPKPGLGLRGPDRYAPQELGKTDWSLSLLELPGASNTGASLEQYATVLSQGSSSTCVANAWEGALLIEARRLGFTGVLCKLGSRLFGYYNARAESSLTFTDSGTYLRTYASALKKVGRCPESVWPFILSRVNRRPSTRAYQKANAMRGIRGYYRIYGSGEKRLSQICAALEAGHPVVFGMRIDEAFRNSSGSNVISIPTGAFIGGHAMCCVGYRWVNSERQFRILNSWGKGWRDGGYCWFTEELMAWSRLEDLWCASLTA